MGWTTHVPHHVLKQDFEPVTQRVQAELLARVYLCSIVSGVEPRTFWYDFRNDGDDPFYFEHNLGTLRHDGQPKPAYLAFATLTRVLDGLNFAGPVDAGPGNLAFRFLNTNKDREVIALWNPVSAATAGLKLSRQHAKLLNAMGEETACNTQTLPGKDASRVLQIPLKPGAPVYLLLD
jgi:hypothetical protein